MHIQNPLMLKQLTVPSGHDSSVHRMIDLAARTHILGCAADADLVLAALPGAPPIGRIQAIIRMRDGLCSIENVSALGRVCINDRPLGMRQSACLRPGDALRIGGHDLVLETADKATQPAGAEAAKTETEETRDVFDSLLGGPGVIPVGSPTPPLPDGGEVHILSNTRPTVLDDDDPMLGQREHDITAVLGTSKSDQSNS